MDITFEDVSYTYQANTPFAHQALDKLTFHIPSGTYVAIIGHTGSGKSTLIQHLNGLVKPTEGKVTIGDFHLTKQEKTRNMKKLRSQVGVVFQYPEHQLFEETVEEDIAFGPKNFSVPEEEIKERVENAIQQVGLSNEFLTRSPFDLSGGQMRRIAIAGVLAVNPKVLVLDEPTAGLDPRGQKEMMKMFYHLHKEQNLTTVLITHSMEDALAYADKVIILNKGQLYMEGMPEDLFVQKKALQKVDLDVPDIIQFLQRFEERFDQKIPFERQTIAEIAKSVQQIIKGVESS